MPLQYKLKRLLQSGFLPNVSVAFARIFAAKPHSADAERLISVSTALKSTGHARMLLKTENLNLYVHCYSRIAGQQSRERWRTNYQRCEYAYFYRQ